MLKDGNLLSIDFNQLKPKLIESFVRFYGEQHREYITKRIKEISYIPFHTRTHLQKYYNYLITQKYGKDIDDRFNHYFGKHNYGSIVGKLFSEHTKVPATIAQMKNIIHSDDDLSRSDYNDLVKHSIDQSKKKFFQIFKLDGNDIDKTRQLKAILYNALASIEEIKRENPNYVFDKMHDVSDRLEDITMTFAHNVYSKYRYPDSSYQLYKNYRLISDSTIEDILNLHSNGILFDGNIFEPGLISAFTTESEKILSENNEFLIRDVITKRLLFLIAHGVQLHFFDINNLKVTPTSLLLQEFNYQKKNLPVNTDLGYTMDYLHKKKAIATGQFFPQSSADDIEAERKSAILRSISRKPYIFTEPVNETIDYSFDKSYTTQTHGMAQPYYRDIYDYEYSDIIINEDENCTDEYLLSVIIHEVNHCLGIKLKNSNWPWNTKHDNGLIIPSFLGAMSLKSFNTHCPEVGFSHLEENINTLQTDEILEEFTSLYPDTEFFSHELPPEETESTYNYYNIFTKDFYEKYYREINENKVNQDYSLFISPIFKTLHSKKLEDKLKSSTKIDLPYKLLDFETVAHLAEIIEEYDRDILPYLTDKHIPSSVLSSENWQRFLPTMVADKIQELLDKKNQVLDLIEQQEFVMGE